MKKLLAICAAGLMICGVSLMVDWLMDEPTSIIAAYAADDDDTPEPATPAEKPDKPEPADDPPCKPTICHDYDTVCVAEDANGNCTRWKTTKYSYPCE